MLMSNISAGELFVNFTANAPIIPCSVSLQLRRTTCPSRVNGTGMGDFPTLTEIPAAKGGIKLDQINAPMGEISLMNASYSLPL